VNTIESPIRLPANWLTRIPTNSSSNSNSSQPKSTLEQLSKQKAAIEQELSKREGWKIQQALDRLNARRKILKYFSDDGPTRRELYVKHLEFFRAGALYRSRLFRAANRIGKTDAAGYETALHLMGIYPPWWEGRRFDRPIEAWGVNISWEKVRDVNQQVLCGNPERPDEIGTGMVPGERLIRHNFHGYTKHGMDTIAVRHVSGGDSILQFKSYSQGRESFESNAKDLIWLDEECPEDIYTACEMRTMTTNGILLLTYTPVLGLTPLTELFEREADRPGQIMGAA
jgi:phage terminase large subunit-like protein